MKGLEKLRNIYIYIYRLTHSFLFNLRNLFNSSHLHGLSNLNSSIKFSKLFRIVTAFSFVLLLTLSYIFLNPTNNVITTTIAHITGGDKGVHATDTPATSGAPFSSLVTLNIDLTHPNASVELTPHDTNGTFASSSASSSAAFNVSTNNYTGYTLSISSSANTGYLTNTNTTLTTNNTLSSISSVTTESTFASSSSTNLNNKWGYKPSKYNGSDNTSFVPAPSIANPTTGSAILDTTSTYNTTTNGDPITTETSISNINTNTYTIGLGARVDSTVATGSYEGTFVLQVVGNPVPVTITYTDTSGDNTVSNLPAKYEGEVSDTEAPISTTIPTRTGYTFKSWCLGTVTAGTSSNNYVDTCTGTTYNPSTTQNTQYIGVDLTHSNTMTLVAMWEKSTVTVTLTPGTGVSSVAVTGADVKSGSGTASAIVYYGGNITITATMSSGYDWVNWTGSATYTNISQSISNVTSNLNFTANGKVSCTTTMQEFNSSNLDSGVTNLTLCDSRDGQAYQVAKLADGKWWMLENLALDKTTLKSGVTLDSSNTNLVAGKTFNLPASTTTDFTSTTTGYTTAAINTESKNSTQPLAVGQSGAGKIGVYYNYCAASAGTYCMNPNSNSGNATSDICPKGWRLPTGGASGEFQALRSQYSSAGEFALALRTPLSGQFYNGSAKNQGSSGFFWSSTFQSGSYMYFLHVNAGDVYPQNGMSRFYGYSVRCVFGSIMQNVTTSDLATMMPNAGDTATLMDSRDGTEYTIGKLADGNYWMLDNLALGSTYAMTLTSADTNMTASSWTLHAGVTSGMNVYDSDKINVAYKDTTQPLAMEQSGSGKVGVYYNYCAATVGQYCSSGTTSTDASKDNDICPKNWRMPTSGTSGEYQALRNEYSSDGAFAAALKTPLSGYFYNSSAVSRGSYGFFWSSTRNSGFNMYVLRVRTSDVAPQHYGNRGYGYSVRCVYSPTMQNVTTSDLAAMMPNAGDTATLMDSRDGKSYTIGKINGQYWMTQNLDLTGGTTLTSADSNVSSNYTLPASSTSGFSDDSTAYVYNSGSTTCGNNSPCYSYYSYAAATVGTGPSGMGPATSDICPRGWRLPTDEENHNIVSSYTTGTALTAAPFYGVYAGRYGGGSYYSGVTYGFYGGGTYGFYWSSMGFGPTDASNMVFDSSSAELDTVYRSSGLSVRCVAQ